MKKYFSFALLYDIFDPKDPGDAKIGNFNNILLLRVEDNILQLKIGMINAPAMTMAQHIKNLPHNLGRPPLLHILLPINHLRQTLPIAQLHHNIKPMGVLEQFVDFVDVGMVDLFEFVDLVLEEDTLGWSHFVLVDDVDGTDEFGGQVDGFAQLVEFVGAQVGGQDLVLALDGALDLADEVVLAELYLELFFVDFARWLLLLEVAIIWIPHPIIHF